MKSTKSDRECKLPEKKKKDGKGDLIAEETAEIGNVSYFLFFRISKFWALRLGVFKFHDY